MKSGGDSRDGLYRNSKKTKESEKSKKHSGGSYSFYYLYSCDCNTGSKRNPAKTGADNHTGGGGRD